MWIGLRNVGVLLCHVLLAVIGTAIIEGPFVRVKYPIADAVVRQDYISASAAFCLGYSIQRIWKTPSSKWMWLLGLAWVVQRAIAIILEQPMQLPSSPVSLLTYFSGIQCEADVRSCNDWSGYTIPFIRAAFYSAGAFLCDRLGSHGVLRWPKSFFNKQSPS